MKRTVSIVFATLAALVPGTNGFAADRSIFDRVCGRLLPVRSVTTGTWVSAQ
jgi:hypothetical protein